MKNSVKNSIKMALFRYFYKKKKESDHNSLPLPLPSMVPSLSLKELEEVNQTVAAKTTELQQASKPRREYNDYTSEQRAMIGKYAAENGATRASRYYSKVLAKNVPESTARRLKSEYLAALKEKVETCSQETLPLVSQLPKKKSGRPLLLRKDVDDCVQEFIESLRKVGGVVNTSIVMAAAEGIVAAKSPSSLAKHGGHLDTISRGWVRSLFTRMHYVKRKGSNAGKIIVKRFKEVEEVFMADIRAEVLMNDIHPQLIFNWDQTPLYYVPTGEWTMNKAKEKIIPIASSDDKRQITAVLAVTLTGEFLPPQLIYQGKTNRSHPTVQFPKDWDVWHTENHWSNEETMKRYIEKIIVPFVSNKRRDLKLTEEDDTALAIFDSFKGQTTPAIYSLLESHKIRVVQVPANCTDKLQPLDISLNKPVKHDMRKQFHVWYADQVKQKIEEGVPINEVKVEMPASIMKSLSAKWIIATWNVLKSRPELATNGFQKSGILEAVNSV